MIEIKLFGTTSILSEGRLSADLGGVKPRQILQILALAAGTPVSKERLADLLWEGDLPRSYLATLESYVCVLRRQIGSRGRTSVISTTPRGYVLDASRVGVDLATCRQLLVEARTNPTLAVDLVEAALGLARDPLLASDPFAPWGADERRVITSELVEACVHASAHALSTGQHPAAVRLARRGVELDGLAEEAGRQLMQALRRCDRGAEALQVFGNLRAVMADQLGVEPARSTQELYLEILREQSDPARASGPDSAELRILLVLLRRALDSTPGITVPRGDSALSYAAVQALAVA
jgi:DNA-binding SARP family transcriptional activator